MGRKNKKRSAAGAVERGASGGVSKKMHFSRRKRKRLYAWTIDIYCMIYCYSHWCICYVLMLEEKEIKWCCLWGGWWWKSVSSQKKGIRKTCHLLLRASQAACQELTMHTKGKKPVMVYEREKRKKHTVSRPYPCLCPGHTWSMGRFLPLLDIMHHMVFPWLL